MGDTSEPTRRWFHFTPDRLVLGLVAVEGVLLHPLADGAGGRRRRADGC